MESLKKIEEFLSVSSGSGYGSGDGSGYGYGSGDGDGSGYGYGSGDGDGSGYGYGSGSGSGYGIKSFNGEDVFGVDGIQTLIDKVRGNIAKGRILDSNLTTTPCFVVKQNNLFAHGKTIREAMAALTDKLFDDMSEEDRIDEFVKAHPTEKPYPNTDLYDWHHKLTGSCEMGRKTFAQDHGIDLNGEMTVSEFIKLTENAYGGSTIKKLAERYNPS